MSQIKVCPRCGAEYYLHAVKCADCGVSLVFLEEGGPGRREARPVSSGAELVEIRRDAKGWIEELSHMLMGNGVSSRVELAGGCKPGSCGAQYLLLVPKDAAKDAMQMIEDYFVEMHPEAGQSEEWASEGKCPACGHTIEAEMKECPDCGLSLAVEEEDCDRGPGGGCR